MSHVAGSADESGKPEDLQPYLLLAEADPDEAEWRARVAGSAQLIRAFDPTAFETGGDGATVELAAGALVLASTMLIDEQIEDTMTLSRSGGTAASSSDELLAMGELPALFAAGYDGRFARRFLIALVAITGRLSMPNWEPPACMAEALALHLVVRRAAELLADHGCLNNEEALNLYAGFEDLAFEDTDFERLYVEGLEDSVDGATDIGDASTVSRAWFAPTSPRPVHLFLAETA